MKQFNKLSTKPRNDKPCEMVTAYCEHIMAHGTLTTFLQGFAFSSRGEIEKAIIDLEYAVLFDPYMQDKRHRTADPVLFTVYRKAEILVNQEGKLEKLATTMGGDLWHKHFAPLIK